MKLNHSLKKANNRCIDRIKTPIIFIMKCGEGIKLLLALYVNKEMKPKENSDLLVEMSQDNISDFSSEFKLCVKYLIFYVYTMGYAIWYTKPKELQILLEILNLFLHALVHKAFLYFLSSYSFLQYVWMVHHIQSYCVSIIYFWITKFGTRSAIWFVGRVKSITLSLVLKWYVSSNLLKYFPHDFSNCQLYNVIGQYSM